MDLISRQDLIEAINRYTDPKSHMDSVLTVPAVDNYITSIQSDIQYQIEDNLLERIAKKLFDRTVPTFEHKCNNCGGTLEMKADEHIFKCPYCGSCYAVGTMQIHG